MVKSQLFQKLWAGIEDMVLMHINDALHIHEDVYHDEEEDRCWPCSHGIAKVEDHDDGCECDTFEAHVAERMLEQTVDELWTYTESLEAAVRIMGQIIVQERSHHNGKRIWQNYPMCRERVNEALKKKPVGRGAPIQI